MSEIVDLAKLVASGQLKFTKGEVFTLNQPVAFLPIDWIVTLQKTLEKKKLDNLIYFSAKEAGVRWFKSMYEYFKISPEDVIKWGINLLVVAGWGETKTPEINLKEKHYKIILNGGAEGKSFGKVNHAVDHFVRGCYAAGAKVLFGAECDAIETHCISEGYNHCEFVAQPTEEFNKKDPRVKKQLSFSK